VGTAKEDLTALLYESLFRTRKNFGMFGQIQISIRDATPRSLSVGVSTHHPLQGAAVAVNVRNAVLNWLQDLLPVERFIVVYENPTLGITDEVHDLAYAQDLAQAGHLSSSEILIGQHADPEREALRPRFREAWERFIEEGEA
jgi:hypothetical protein